MPRDFRPFLLVAAVACQRLPAPPIAVVPAAVVAPPVAPARPAEPPAEAEDSAERVVPVYPVRSGAPDPLASTLCEVLHELPEARRAACCGQKSGIVLVDPCKQALTQAVQSHAATLDAAEVERCRQALILQTTGCAWVGPWHGGPPAACLGLVHGQRVAGAKCRSSLECTRGMHCAGAGPTEPGICAPAQADGGSCGGSVDVLATYVRQTDVDASHAECVGFCDRHRCASRRALTADCTIDAACQPGLACIGGHCRAEKELPAAGSPCLEGPCAQGARCVRGHCVVPSGDGPCDDDYACIGTCRQGHCAMRCDVR
jgi:hypothetical protein